MVPCIYGISIVRVCHVLKRLQKLYPGKRILIVNTDIEKYYLRMHKYGGIAAACITILRDVAYVLNILPLDTLRPFTNGVFSTKH